MAGLFNIKQPTVEKAPPPPDRSAADISALAAEQRRKAQGSQTLTLLTGGRGDDTGLGSTVKYLGSAGKV
jgi:hypothetical protein